MLDQNGASIEEMLIRQLHRDKVLHEGLLRRLVDGIDAQLERSRRVRERMARGTTRKRVVAMYKKYRPEMLCDVEGVLETYFNREEVLLAELVKEYGPEGDENEAANTLTSPVKYINRRRAETMRKRDVYGFLTSDEVGEPQFDTSDVVKYLEEVGLGKSNRGIDVAGLKADLKFTELLVKSGLDDHSRAELWVSFARHSKNEANYSCEVGYEDAVGREVPANSSIAIEKDMDRTFPDCNQFNKGEPTRDELYNVLKAYSAVNPDGYCQGLNFITGILLLFLKDGEAFEVLNYVTNSAFYNAGYYGMSMSMCNTDQGVLEELVQSELPDVLQRLKDLNVTVTDLCVKWFLCIFVDSFPLKTTLVLWDFYLLHGIRFTFAFTMAFLHTHQEVLTTSPDLTTIIVSTRSSASNLTSPRAILELAVKKYLPQLTSSKLASLREQVGERLEADKKEKEALRQKLRKQREEREAAAGSPKTPSGSPKSRLKGIMSFRKKGKKDG